MNSSRSYIVNGLINWIVDSGLTPHIVLDASFDEIVVPQEYVQNGRIVLNISGTAVRNFHLGPDGLEFDARFQKMSRHVRCPTGAIIGIYARENGEGMMFEPERDGVDVARSSSSDDAENETQTTELPPHLRLVKD